MLVLLQNTYNKMKELIICKKSTIRIQSFRIISIFQNTISICLSPIFITIQCFQSFSCYNFPWCFAYNLSRSQYDTNAYDLTRPICIHIMNFREGCSLTWNATFRPPLNHTLFFHIGQANVATKWRPHRFFANLLTKREKAT